MTAENAVRRKISAREAAERIGCSERTVRRLFAEPREDYLARAAARRAQVLALRAEGLKTGEIAERLEVPGGTVRRIIAAAKKDQRGGLASDPRAS